MKPLQKCNKDENAIASSDKQIIMGKSSQRLRNFLHLGSIIEEVFPNSSNAELYRQLCEECPHLICFLAAVCKSGQLKSVEKGVLYGPNTLKNLKQEMLFVLLPIFALISTTRSSAPAHYRNGLLLLHGSVKAATLQRCHHRPKRVDLVFHCI